MQNWSYNSNKIRNLPILNVDIRVRKNGILFELVSGNEEISNDESLLFRKYFVVSSACDNRYAIWMCLALESVSNYMTIQKPMEIAPLPSEVKPVSVIYLNGVNICTLHKWLCPSIGGFLLKKKTSSCAIYVLYLKCICVQI